MKHQIETAAKRGWGQLSNGVLLQAAEDAGFELMLTADQNLKYQQNLSKRQIALVVLGSNRWPFVQKHIPEIAAVVDSATPATPSLRFRSHLSQSSGLKRELKRT